MDRLRRRDADGRMVREPCRDPTKVGRDPTKAPRRSRGSECQRVVLWWGRGEGRDMVSIMAWHSPWLSQATRRVELRSPLDRLSIACGGERPAIHRRSLGGGLYRRRNPGDAADRSTCVSTFSLSHGLSERHACWWGMAWFRARNLPTRGCWGREPPAGYLKRSRWVLETERMGGSNRGNGYLKPREFCW
jgi:hypothetical protein